MTHQHSTTAPLPTRQARSWRFIALIVLLIVGLAQPIGAAAATPINLRAPTLPAHVHATAGDGAALVSWAAPYDNGSPITSYTVTVYQGGTNGPVTLTRVVGPDMTSVRLIGVDARLLRLGIPYTFTVSATNAVGSGPASNPSNTIIWLPGITPPGQPQNLAAAPALGSATLSWIAPPAGGAPIVGYEITLYRADTQQVVDWKTVAGNVTSITVAGLDNRTPYIFTVQALNAIGWGPVSDRANIVTASARVPDAPTNVQAVADNGTATISWTAPYDGSSPIVKSIVTAYLGTTSNVVMTREVLGNATSVRLIGVDGPILHNGTPYTFTVTAVNAVGQSSPSARSNLVTPQGAIPDAPGNVRAVSGPGSITVTWSAPFTGGSAITRYDVRTYVATSWQRVSDTLVDGSTISAVINTLPRGTSYSFAILAENAIGWSAESARSNVVALANRPGAPTNVQAVAGPHWADVSWSVPNDGGSPITTYTVRAYLGTTSIVVASRGVFAGMTSVRMIGVDLPLLQNGTGYTFTVTATNALGQSDESARSNQIVLPAAPSQPQNFAVTPGDASAQLRWDAPSSDGGSPITGYLVTASDGVHAAITLPVSTTSATLTGLTNDTTYAVSVVAVNAAGQGAAACASVTPKNEPPALTVAGDQAVLYGHALTLQIAARDPEAADNLTLSASGLPAGLSFKDNGDGTGAVSGAVQAPAGTYTATFSVNDSRNPAVSRTLAIVVSPAKALLQPAGSNPIRVKATGSWAKAITLQATLLKTGDDVAGSIAKAGSVTFTLTSLVSGASRTGVAGVTDNRDGTASIAYTFRHLPVGVYRLDLGVDNQYYHGSGQSMLAVYDPAHKFSVRGSGELARGGADAQFTFVATSSSSARGLLRYTEQQDRENLALKSTSIDALVIRGHTAYLEGRATLNGQSGYRFVLTASSNSYRNKADQLGLWVLDGNGATVSALTFDPVDLSTGRTSISIR